MQAFYGAIDYLVLLSCNFMNRQVAKTRRNGIECKTVSFRTQTLLNGKKLNCIVNSSQPNACVRNLPRLNNL